MNVTPECPDIEYQEDDEEDGVSSRLKIPGLA